MHKKWCGPFTITNLDEPSRLDQGYFHRHLDLMKDHITKNEGATTPDKTHPLQYTQNLEGSGSGQFWRAKRCNQGRPNKRTGVKDSGKQMERQTSPPALRAKSLMEANPTLQIKSHQNTHASTCTIPIPLFYMLLEIYQYHFLWELSFCCEKLKERRKKKLWYSPNSFSSLRLRFLGCSNFVVVDRENGSDRVDSGGHGSERAGGCGAGQVGDGPEAHGRPVPEVPKLQWHGTRQVYMLALVGRRFRLPDMCRFGSHGV